MLATSQEYYTIFPVVIYYPRNSYLTENFNKKLMLFDSSGLIQHWASREMDMKYLDFKPVKLGPKQLSLNHLSGALQMLAGGLALSTVSFFIEAFWKKIKNWKIISSKVSLEIKF